MKNNKARKCVPGRRARERASANEGRAAKRPGQRAFQDEEERKQRISPGMQERRRGRGGALLPGEGTRRRGLLHRALSLSHRPALRLNSAETRLHAASAEERDVPVRTIRRR